MGRQIWILVGVVTLSSLVTSQLGFGDEKNTGNTKEVVKPGARLGLLASTLGVPAVPGANYGNPVSEGEPKKQPEYNPAATVELQNGKGSYGGGGHQSNPIPDGEPKKQAEYNSAPTSDLQNGKGSYGGGGHGHQGGNSGPCQCVPVEYCQSSSGGSQGGNGPIIDDGSHGGKDPEFDQGYGHGDGTGGSNPIKDGAGVIDIRIVNKPPGPGGVQCLAGQVFCCGAEIVGPGPGGDSGSGYSKCGSRSFLNVPGWTQDYGQAQFGAYPWMAVILGKGNNYIGAGALLNSYYVLTAAHKVQNWKPGTAMKVRFGEWNAKDDDEPYKNVEIEVERVDIHPGFNPENLYNDVALIKLASPVNINSNPHIKSVCLPQGGVNYVGQRCWVAGFGKDAFGNGKHSFIMKEVDVPVVESNTCENLLRGTRLGRYFELNRKSFLCAGGEEGKDACTGDGGSPLVCEKNGSWTVVGLVAWGIGCADYAVPGVYVNVPNYVQWIENKIYY